MSSEYVVQPGDSLSRIASRHGLGSWRDIYFHPDNADFRRRRPNPNVIHPGDRLNLPSENEFVALPEDADFPRFLRLPWDFASRMQVPRLISLAPSPMSSPSSSIQLGSFQAHIVIPSRMIAPALPLPRPNPGFWQYGGGPPLPSAPCGPWGCARGPFDLDRPRVGYFGDVLDAWMSMPGFDPALDAAGSFLWSDAPVWRRALVGSVAGLAIGGGVTALAASESLRDFALEHLNDVSIPVGEAILLIPGLDSHAWIPTVLRPIKFSLIWQEPGPVSGPPEPGTPSGLQGTGGLLILDLQQVMSGGDDP